MVECEIRSLDTNIACLRCKFEVFALLCDDHSAAFESSQNPCLPQSKAT